MQETFLKPLKETTTDEKKEQLKQGFVLIIGFKRLLVLPEDEDYDIVKSYSERARNYNHDEEQRSRKILMEAIRRA